MRVDEAGTAAGRRLRREFEGAILPPLAPGPRSRPMLRVTAIAVAVALVLTGAVVVARSVGRDDTSSAPDRTWTRTPLRSAFGASVESVEVAGNDAGFVAAVRRDESNSRTRGFELWSSSDGRRWSRRFRAAGHPWFGTVAATRRGFLVAVATEHRRLRTFVSDDGTDWSRGATPPHAEDPGFLGSDGEVFTLQDPSPGAAVPTWLSRDGRRWSARRAPYVPLARLGSRAVTLTSVSTMQPNRVATSSDLRHWKVLPGPLPPRLGRPLVAGPARRRVLLIQYGADPNLAGERLWTSIDARTWTEVDSFQRRFPTGNPDHLVPSGTWWVLGGNRGGGQQRRATMWTTPDLVHWIEMPATLRGPANRGDGVLLAASGSTVVGVANRPGYLWIWRRPRG